jgi:hypothetical protein
MGCQSDPGPGQRAQRAPGRDPATPQQPVRRVRLTDQALVAVTIARQLAAGRSIGPSSADLVLGLATEPEGWAGHLLRAGGERPMIALAARARSQPPDLTGLDEAVSRAATRAQPRPPGTADLLVAALEHGGRDLPELLAVCGFPVLDLESVRWRLRASSWYLDAEEDWGTTAETVTLTGPDQPRLTKAAARAVGRVRAIAGGAVDLLTALDLDPAIDLTDWTGTSRTDIVLARLEVEREQPAAGDPGWDLGLDPVLEAARVLAGQDPVSIGPLLHATLVAGGRGPLTILDAAHAAHAAATPDETE